MLLKASFNHFHHGLFGTSIIITIHTIKQIYVTRLRIGVKPLLRSPLSGQGKYGSMCCHYIWAPAWLSGKALSQ